MALRQYVREDALFTRQHFRHLIQVKKSPAHRPGDRGSPKGEKGDEGMMPVAHYKSVDLRQTSSRSNKKGQRTSRHDEPFRNQSNSHSDVSEGDVPRVLHHCWACRLLPKQCRERPAADSTSGGGRPLAKGQQAEDEQTLT